MQLVFLLSWCAFICPENQLPIVRGLGLVIMWTRRGAESTKRDSGERRSEETQTQQSCHAADRDKLHDEQWIRNPHHWSILVCFMSSFMEGNWIWAVSHQCRVCRRTTVSQHQYSDCRSGVELTMVLPAPPPWLQHTKAASTCWAMCCVSCWYGCKW